MAANPSPGPWPAESCQGVGTRATTWAALGSEHWLGGVVVRGAAGVSRGRGPCVTCNDQVTVRSPCGVGGQGRLLTVPRDHSRVNEEACGPRAETGCESGEAALGSRPHEGLCREPAPKEAHMTSGRVTSTPGKGRRVFLGSLAPGKPLGGDPWRRALVPLPHPLPTWQGGCPAAAGGARTDPPEVALGFQGQRLLVPHAVCYSFCFPHEWLRHSGHVGIHAPHQSVIPVSFRGHRGLWWDPEICAPNYCPQPGGGHLCASDKGEQSLGPGACGGAQKQASPPLQGDRDATLPALSHWAGVWP